ncbi:hypothetical protein [Stieleria varia]|uniref:YHS domain protein n=1 Tax=Stieleria varia TaxID=2528005 RepID=A0A5C5ZYX7_9BACT|nr:hypothetical protein [Stieleria varia]TWT92814.1 hypothetical protein Pla52n_61790 [Stieleria varia]
MMKQLTAFAAIVMLTGTAFAADVDLKGIQCVVAAKPVDASKSAEYKDGKVYFCCGGCAGKFAKDSKPFAEKANHQLVATKQYAQKGCPFSGGPVDPEVFTMIGETKVGFCCAGCKGKVDKAADDDAKRKLVFNEKTFEKTFEKAKKETSR